MMHIGNVLMKVRDLLLNKAVLSRPRIIIFLFAIGLHERVRRRVRATAAAERDYDSSVGLEKSIAIVIFFLAAAQGHFLSGVRAVIIMMGPLS
jgi:hypothetical protein